MCSSTQGFFERFSWEGGRRFFNTTMAHSCELMIRKAEVEHRSITKWRNEIQGMPAEKEIWRNVCKCYRLKDENHFEIIYKSPASYQTLGFYESMLNVERYYFATTRCNGVTNMIFKVMRTLCIASRVSPITIGVGMG